MTTNPDRIPDRISSTAELRDIATAAANLMQRIADVAPDYARDIQRGTPLALTSVGVPQHTANLCAEEIAIKVKSLGEAAADVTQACRGILSTTAAASELMHKPRPTVGSFRAN